MSVLKLISSKNFISVNKYLIKTLGLNEAIILGLFASIDDYNGKEWFYCTYDKIEEETGLTKYLASNAIQSLLLLGIIDDHRQGVPCRRFFRLNEERIFDSLKLSEFTTGSEASSRLEVESVDRNNNTYNNTDTIIQNEYIIDDDFINQEKGINKSTSINIFNNESFEILIVNAFVLKLKELYPNFKEPNINAWAKEIDKMVRIDKRSEQDIKDVLNFATNDSFWQSNILSTAKLRKHFDRLYIQMSQKTSNRKVADF